MGGTRTRGSIKSWADGIRARLERVRSARAPASPSRPDPKLEPLEPRILLSADVGLAPDEGLTLIALTPELAAPQIEIHDEVLVRESSDPDVDETEDASRSQLDEEALTSEGAAPAADAAVDPEASSSTGEPSAEPGELDHVDPGRADRALASLVWDAARTTDTWAGELSEESQLVVIDARVPEVESLLGSLLQSTADLDADDAAEPGASEPEPAEASETSLAIEVEADVDASDRAGAAADPSTTAAGAAEALEARGIRVIVLDEGRDGLDQVGEILEAFQGVTALHLVSHGSAGSLQLGQGRVTSDTLQQRMRALRGWGKTLSPDADILLYGCHVAHGEVGIEFVSSLAAATGADVAASTDATGGAGFGDWDLEVATGRIEAATIHAAGFAAALETTTVTASDANDDITVSFDSATSQWTVTGTGAPVAPFGSPAHDPGGAQGEGVIRIEALDGQDTITLESVDESFAGTIQLVGGIGVDSITIEAVPAGFAGRIEVLGGADQDTLSVQSVEAGFAGTILLSGGGSNDEIVLGAAGEDLAGAFDLQGGDGNDTYRILADDWGAATITEAASGGTDTLAFAPDRTAPIAGQGSIDHADAESAPEIVTGVAVDTATLVAGLDDLVDWARGIQESGDLARRLAGISGTADVTVGSAIDLGDVFDQLRQYVRAGVEDAGGSLDAAALHDLLDGFRAFGDGNRIDHFASGIVGDAFVTDFASIAGPFTFTLDLDGADLELTDPTADPATLSALVDDFNRQLGASELSGRVRAVAVTGVGGHQRLGFEVDDATARELTVTGTSAGAAALGFAEGVARVESGLDADLKGLGDLGLNANGWVGVGLDLDVSGSEPVLGFAFHLEAVRRTEFKIDLGEASDDYALGFGPNDNLRLSSIFEADVTLRIAGEPTGTQSLAVDVVSPRISAQVLNGGAGGETSLFAGDPVQMNIGFLGARVGPLTEAPVIEMHVAFAPGVGWVDVTADSAGDIAARVEQLTAETDDGNDANDPIDTFRVNLPVEVLLPAGFDGGFGTDMAIESALGLSALEGRNALDGDANANGEPDAFESLESVELFAKLDPTKYLSLLAQIRSGLDALRQSEIFQAVDIPFVQGALGKVADLGDAFGDAILFDDGDDGIDSRNDDVLVTRLNSQLRDAKLDSLVQFRVKLDENGLTKVVLVAVGTNVETIQIVEGAGAVNALVFDETDPVASILESEVVDLDSVREKGFELTIKVTQRGDAADKETTIKQVGGSTAEGSPDLEDESKTSSLRSLGNDVARLLNESNEATFETMQELTERLLEIVFPGDFDTDANKPFKWDSANSLLTFELDFDSQLIDVDLPVDFDLDLGPIGDIAIEPGSKITVGGEVGFGLTLGLNLGKLPGKEIKADEGDATDLTDLLGVDEIADIIELTPSITAKRDPGESVNDVDEEDAKPFTLEEVALREGVEVTFGAAQNEAVVAESLINGVMNLTSPEGTQIRIDRDRDGVFESVAGRTVPLRNVPGFEPFSRYDEILDTTVTGYKLTEAFSFDMFIETFDGIGWVGESFTVQVADNEYAVNTQAAAKQKLLRDVEKAIAAAQKRSFDPEIHRADGRSWAEDGFAVGDTIRITNSGGNDGLFVIESFADGGQTLVVDGDLADQSPVTSGSAEGDFKIQGPGQIRWTNASDGKWQLELGERIVVSGTEANDGIYLISRIADGPGVGADHEDDVLVVDGFFDLVDEDGNATEPASSTSIRVTANGAPVRFDAERFSEDATFELLLTIGDELRPVLVTVSRDGMKGPDGAREEGADSDLSNNRNLSDLVADVQNAIDAAIDAEIDALVEASPEDESEIRDAAPEMEVRLDGTRLVIGLKNAARLKGDPILDLEELQGGDTLVVTRSGGDETFTGDGFAIHQLVVVKGSGDTDGEYEVAAVSEAELWLTRRSALPPIEADAAGVVITQTFALASSNEVTEALLGFEAPAGSPVSANLDDMVITTSDGESVAVVLDGATDVHQALERINNTLAGAGMLATIALNEDKTGFDVTQTVGVDTEKFRIESVNGSFSALRLGILGADAMSDENEDGVVDQRDGDDVIEGGAVGGPSLFDRFFLDDVGIELALEVDTAQGASADDGIAITGDFGFFDVAAEATGDVTAVAAFTLVDPIAATHGITVADLYETFRDLDLLKKMVDPREALSFGGATLDDDAGTITFSNDGDKGEIARDGEGTWREDRFKVDQKITVNDGQGTEAVFQILAIRDEGGRSILELDRGVGELKSGGAGDGADDVRIESALATLTLKDLSLPGGIAEFTGLSDARVVVSLLDLGNPFLNETRQLDDGGVIGEFTASNVLLLGDAIDELAGIEDGDTVEIEYEDAAGALVTATALVRSVDETNKRELTLREDVEGAAAGLKIKKLVVTRPIDVDVDTPDFGELLDLSNIGFDQILDGLLALSAFLDQFEEFEFLNEDIPLVGVSVNDLLGYADQFRDMVNEIKADPAGSFQSLETKIEDLLGIDDGVPVPGDPTTAGLDPFDIELEFVTEARGEAGEADDHRIAKLSFVVGAGFRESLGVEFDVGEAGVLAGAADLEAYGGISLALAIGIDLSKTRVHGADDLKVELNHTGEEGGDTIRRSDGGSFLADGFMVGQSVEIAAVGDFAAGRYEIGEISEDGLIITLRDELKLRDGVDASQAIRADVDASEVEGSREISIYDETGISARLTGKADDVSFRAAVGPIGIFIQEDDPNVTAIEIGGAIDASADTNGDGVVDAKDDKSIFEAGLSIGAAEDGDRKLITELSLDDFEIDFDAAIAAILPVAFPTDSLDQGRVEFHAGLSIGRADSDGDGSLDTFAFDSTPPTLTAYDSEDPETPLESLTDLFDLDALLDLGQLSIFDNVLLAVDGIDFFLGGLQDILDGEVFGVELPLIGDGLSEGAGFIEDLREGFLADFREGVEAAEDFVADLDDPDKNFISKLLFDVLSETGLLLVEVDGEMVKATKAGLEAGLFTLSQAVSVSGVPDLTGSVDALTEWVKDPDSQVKWNMTLGQSLLDVDTDLDIDLGVPGLGFEAEGPLGLKLGWDLDFGFGLNFEEGFFLDIAPEDGTDLEVRLDVTLPDRLAGQLAFLQLDAINDGSGLGATFVVDVYNQMDLEPGAEIDERLSFSELSKVRLRAEVEAQALASFDMLLALNSDLIPSAPSVFPTVGADFVLDWSIGGHLKDAGEVQLDGDTLTRSNGDWEADGFRADQRIIIQGFEDDAANGQYFIQEVAGDTIRLKSSSGVTGVRQTGGLDIDSLQDLSTITGSMLMEGLNEVAFNSIELDLGSFISDLIAPILSEIQEVTQPLQPIIDLVTSPLPVVSEFAGPTTLLDLAGIFGTVRPEFLKAVADVITLANAIPAEKGEVKIAFGDFKIFDRETSDPDMDLSDPNFDATTIEKPKPDADLFDKTLDKGSGSGANSSANKKNQDFAKKLKGLDGFSFPFLADPSEIFGLFTGEPVTLIGYDMPALDFEFQYTQLIPLYPPLFLGIGGAFGAHIDFAFGFDTEGVSQFADGGFRNPALIFNGLFVSDNPTDVTGAGPDLPELTFTGAFTVTAELNLGLARAGAGGGLFAEIFFDLFDPDHDGRVRIGEIAENFETEFKFGSPLLAPLAIFDVSGNVKARLFAFLEINLLFATISKEFDLVPPITLVDFDIDFQRKPKLATELADGVLQLNMGAQSGQRLNGDLSDGDEHFEVRDHATDAGKIEVRALGLGAVAAEWQAYDRPTAIIALGGRGNDVIDLSGLSVTSRRAIRLEVEGGEGNDVLIGGAVAGGGVFKGGLGDDVIIGGGGADVIYGDEGHDVIDGGGGDDILFADGGRVVEGEARVTREDLEIAPGRSEIHRADNALWLADGFRAGQTIEISGSTLAVENETEGNDGFYKVKDGWSGGALELVELESGAPAQLDFELTDELKIEIVNSSYRRSIKASARGSDGDDLVLGGLGNDSIFGAGGADVILGGGASVAGQPALDGLRSLARADAVANGTDGRASKRIRQGFSADQVARDDAASDTHDILVGDAGEIRFRLGAGTPVFRDVIETNRGIFFGADEIHGNGGFDRIFGGQGNDVVHGGDDAGDLIFGESGLDELHGDGGADEIHGGRDVDLILGGEGDDRIYGEEGNDILGGGAGADEIFGQSGSDRIWGGTGADRIDGGGEFDTIYGGTGNDVLDGGAGDDVVFGDGPDGVPTDLFEPEEPGPGGGALPADAETYDDVLFVGGGNDRLDGQGGSDEYIVNFRGAANDAYVPIRDTGGLADIDRLTANGTDFDDLFLLRAIEYLDGSSTPADEQFEAFVASINRDGGVERIDMFGVDRVVVNGQQGDDEFAVDDVAGSTELNGGGGRDLFKVGQLYKTPRTVDEANIAVGDFFETVETTRGFLSNGISEAMTINAGADDDEIIVLRNLAVLQVNGEEGDDTITVRAFALTEAEVERQRLLSEEEREALRREDTDIEGGAGADLIQYAVNAPVNIDGGDGLDTVVVIGTEFDDDFVITEQGVYGAGLNVNLVNVELLTVDGAEGDDAFFVQSTQDGLITQILGGLGSDTFDVAGDAPPVVSNDLLGHSGIITHGIESNDARYLGADGEGIAVRGVSANVGDDDEPFARITLSDGTTRIGEDGVSDAYYLALTRRPEDDERVLISVLVPSLTPEQKARGALNFTLGSDPGRIAGTALDGSITVWFDADNWDDPLRIDVIAHEDDALEGESFGVINHQVRSVVHGTGTALDGERYAGSRYDGLALPSVTIQIDDGDEADVLIFESEEATRAFEAAGSSTDGYEVRLSRPPVAGVVEVHVDVTPPPGVVDQISVSSPTASGSGSSLVLRFDASNWNVAQRVDVDGVPDGAREGFHRDFIQHTVVAVGDTDEIVAQTDLFTPASENSQGLSIWPTTSVLLTKEPVQQVGKIGSVDEETITIAYGALVPGSLVGHVVRLSSGPADGQARRIVANDETTMTLEEAFAAPDGADLAGSDFRTSDVHVTVDYRELSGTPGITIEADGDIVREAGSWVADGFERNQIIVVEDANGLLGRYVVEGVGVEGLQTKRVADAGGSHAAGTDSGPLSGVRVYVAELDIDRFLVNSSTLVFLDEDGRPQTREASDVRVEYESLAVGFDGRLEERIAVEVIDDDTAGVIVTQTGSSTNVTEGGWTALSGTPEVSIGANGDIVRGPASGPDDTESWILDGFEIDQELVVANDDGLLGRYRVTGVSDSTLQTERVADDGGSHVPGTGSGPLAGVRVQATPPAIAEGLWTTVDTYEVVLTSAPVSDGPEEGFVDVVVTPEITRTSGGSFAFELQQVVVAEGRPGENLFGDRVVLRFTESNWNVAQTVTVAARQDDNIDGNDTQVFPEIPHTVSSIQGPLLIDGRGGQGSLEGLTRPVMLDGETSQRDATGVVQGIEAAALLVERSALEAELARRASEAFGDPDFDESDYDSIDDLVGRTVELIDVSDLGRGPGNGDFTLITGVTELGDLVRLELDPGWDLGAEELADIDGRSGEDRYAYAITDESPNFFVDEAEQVDVLRMNDEDNPADFEPGHPNGYGRLTAFDPTEFPDTATLLDADPDAFGQGQWGRITGLGMSPDSYIARAWRPGGVTYGRLEGLEIDLGLGNNHFTIDAVHQRNDGVHTYTVIDASDGDDVIEVSVAAPEDPDAGLPFLRIDAGDGDDRVDASPAGLAPSTLAMEIVGGHGADTLIGGDGDDLIYGDFGTSAIANVVDLDAELAAREAARRGPAPETDASPATGSDVAGADPSAVGGVPPRLAAEVVHRVQTSRPAEGGRDRVYGMGGDDRLFGGARGDVIVGGAGSDVLIGDFGRVNDVTPTRRTIETTNLFRGGADSLSAGSGNDVLIGGAGGDVLFGTLGSDVLVGDYIRIVFEGGRVVNSTRLVGPSQDVAASSVFDLYAPTPSPGGPDGRAPELDRADSTIDAPRAPIDAGNADAHSTNAGSAAVRGRHRVEAGDSLWSISERELGDPFKWPEIAEANPQLIRDPNLIEPSWVLRMPSAVTDEDAELTDVDAARANLAAIDERIDAQPRGWGFSAAGTDSTLPQVGEGPPADAGQQRAPEAQPVDDDALRLEDEPLPDQGAHGADERPEEPAQLLSAVWAGLTGWQTRVARRRSQRRWLAFDAQSGRFCHAQIDTERVAADTYDGRW